MGRISFYFLLGALLTGCATRETPPIAGCGIANFAQVEPGIFRGSEPTTSADWKCLVSLGVSNVVKLNEESEGSDAGAKQVGIRVVYCPISTGQQIFGPVKIQLETALTNIYPGTFVHCTHGANRTGTLIILYRVSKNRWSKHDAIVEANRYGWRTTFPALRDYVEDYDAARTSSQH